MKSKKINAKRKVILISISIHGHATMQSQIEKKNWKENTENGKLIWPISMAIAPMSHFPCLCQLERLPTITTTTLIEGHSCAVVALHLMLWYVTRSKSVKEKTHTHTNTLRDNDKEKLGIIFPSSWRIGNDAKQSQNEKENANTEGNVKEIQKPLTPLKKRTEFYKSLNKEKPLVFGAFMTMAAIRMLTRQNYLAEE